MFDLVLYFKYSVICFFALGVIGNGINVFIFSQKRFRKESMFRYLLMCAVTNTLNLLVKFPTTFVYQDYFSVNTSGVSCKLTYFFANFLPYTSAWLLVLNSIDRLVSIKYSKRFLFKNKLKFQITVVSIIFLIFGCLNIQYLIYQDVVIFDKNNITLSYCESVGYNINVYTIFIAFVIQVIIPFIIQIIISILLGYYIIKMKKKLDKSYQKEVKFVVTIISMDTFNLLTCVPYFLFGFIFFFFPKLNSVRFLIVIDALQSVYYSTQMFVFLICNRLFRAQFLYSFFDRKIKD